MRSTLAALVILALAACDSGSSTEPDPTPDPPTPPTVRDWRVAKLSGDQAARLGGPSVAASPRTVVARAGSAAVIGPDGYSDEPLVGVITLTSEAQARGLSLDALPASTLVHWHIEDGAGKLFASTTAPDDSLHILNRWAPSTRAGTYTASAGRLVDGEIVEDETWTLVVEPGPAEVVHVPSAPVRLVDQRPYPLINWIGVTDRHRNYILHTAVARGAVTLDNPTNDIRGYSVAIGDGWGRGEVDVLVEDTVVATVDVLSFPDLSGPWTISLICETPSGTHADIWITGNDTLDVSGHSRFGYPPGRFAAAVGVDSASAAVYGFDLWGRRVVIEAGDTIYDTAAADTTLTGFPLDSAQLGFYAAGAVVISVDTTALIWPAGEAIPHPISSYYFARRLHYLRGNWEADPVIQGIPPLLPLVSTDPLTWSSDDAVAACHSDGWTDATAGTFTVRAGVE